MRVLLAGYNIDAHVLKEAEDAGISKDRLTPEVLSAAYARISRDPRSVEELRNEALEQVSKARKSNQRIIFGMGHHSVAEHAVFNFDITGISRLAIEALEHFRLCSFTEKSQRYITLDHDFVLPKELKDTKFEHSILALAKDQATLYEKFRGSLHERLIEKHPKLNAKKSGRTLLEGWAKEDARYVTLLVATSQLGFTANARNLELIARRLAGSPLDEVRFLGRNLYEATLDVAPSLLLFTDPAPFDLETSGELAALADKLFNAPATYSSDEPSVKLIDYSPDGDQRIAAAMLAASTTRSFGECNAAVKELSTDKLSEIFYAAMRRMEFFDSPPREFEHVTFTFELIMSSACFAQLKRHRMTSQTVRDYDPALGVTVPPAIIECGFENEFMEHANRTSELHNSIKAAHGSAASQYVLTNAHRRRVLLTSNLRELYHFTRLREDTHAQWDIRALAVDMRKAVEKVMPLGTLLLCGKDSFVSKFEKTFGQKPKQDPANPINPAKLQK